MNLAQRFIIGIGVVVILLTILFPANIFGKLEFILTFLHRSGLDTARLSLLLFTELLILTGILLVFSTHPSGPTILQRIVIVLLLGVILQFNLCALAQPKTGNQFDAGPIFAFNLLLFLPVTGLLYAATGRKIHWLPRIALVAGAFLLVVASYYLFFQAHGD
ncbi:MAG: hypothetical protein ACYDBB_25000 [Armatimonadota bacterium]